MQSSDFSFRPSREEIPDDVLARCDSLKSALKMCIGISGMQVKEVAFNLGLDDKHLTRMLSENPNDQRHFPPDLIDKLQDCCGNEIPLRWQALRRGYGLHRLKSALEKENELLQKQLAEQQMKLSTIQEFLKGVRV